MQFEIPLTLLQFLLPPVCAGLLFAGICYYTYMAIVYKSKLYAMVALIAFFAISFVGSEVFILSYGSYYHNWKTAIHFHQSEHLSGAFFVFCFPAYLGILVDLQGRMKKINRAIYIFGLIFAITCVIATFVYPDLFISSTERKFTWSKYEGDFGRGKEGILYIMRDCLLTVAAIYAFYLIRKKLKSDPETRRYLFFPLIGIVLAMLGAAIDTGFVYTGYHFDLLPHVYFSRFSLCITLFVILLMSGLTRHFVDASKEVERTHHRISISEEKYRILVEGTNDLVFTLDDRLHFTTANQSTLKQFGITEKALKEKTFIDMIHFDEGSQGVELELVAQKIRDLDIKRRPVTFKAVLVGGSGYAPKEFEIRLENINIHGKNEIIGKASILPDNALMKYLTTESQQYELDNFLVTAEEVSKRLVANLAKHLTPMEITQLRIGLREILINAIEHGNLEISFDEKTEAVATEGYIDFISLRQKDPKYRDRRVIVKFSLSPERVVYIIEDEGKGFNYKNVLEKAQRANDEKLAHGRGIVMALGIFDSVKFNEKGNKVFLLRKFTPGSNNRFALDELSN
jgi:PAS domain-containing protein/anti-sigma regulatory factor (Ser/Thr protein kinase)